MTTRIFGACRAPVLRAAILALLLAGPAVAQPVPGLGSVDTRRPVPADRVPWNAVGEVETTSGNRCTGTLVGPRSIVTAAHCLVTEDAGALVPAASITFRIGGRSARGVSLRSGPNFDTRQEAPWRADWAVVTLDAPLGTGRAMRMGQEPPREGLALTLPAWQHDRPGELLADLACRVVVFGTFGSQGVMVGHNCAGTSGSSGAPLIARGEDGSYVVVGIQTKAALGRPLGVAVPAFTIPLR
ncbi:trypsin-like serine peptidase [Neoroseomonas oryzicola]|uniref:Trypsin-like serine protease n=1 Tax=Neoroseomonas oryzicola TaxID=535904 RepID=A0A9X9WIB2_9PROT|nr:trypsin-like serine protease [Neoroseomonas oryzicola]MBR0660072.1 trypsin-like serine protease [Neoroseomonas oryzicola]NKE18207.1 trypsin-like serine protease [Neoroseomonas oryzicola]